MFTLCVQIAIIITKVSMGLGYPQVQYFSMPHQSILSLAHHLQPSHQPQHMMLLKFEQPKTCKMPRILRQLANSNCWVALRCLQSLTRKYFSSPSFLKLYSQLWTTLQIFFSLNVTKFTTSNCWLRSKNFTHNQSMCIVFSFTLVRASLLIYIGIVCLHTFCDLWKNTSFTLVTTFLVATLESI